MTTAISPAVTLDSHTTPLPCGLCGGVMTAQDDIDVCVCGSRRVRSQPSVSNVVTTSKLASGGPTTAKIADGPSSTEAKPAAASRDDVLLAAYAELLHILHEMTDVGNDWCAGKLAAFERELGA
jgi:hypothetical protein